jgi:hypothetical protein
LITFFKNGDFRVKQGKNNRKLPKTKQRTDKNRIKNNRNGKKFVLKFFFLAAKPLKSPPPFFDCRARQLWKSKKPAKAGFAVMRNHTILL